MLLVQCARVQGRLQEGEARHDWAGQEQRNRDYVPNKSIARSIGTQYMCR